MSTSVVHVASGREWRGGQRQVWLLAREFQRRQVSQVVVTGAGSELAYRLKTDGIPVREAVWNMGLDPRALAGVLAEVRAGTDLLHAHDAHAVTLTGIAAALGRVPWVATRRVDFHLRRKGFWGRANRVIAISQAVSRILVKDGIAAERVQVVHSGIDLDAARQAQPLGIRAELGLPADTPVAATVGALVPHKDHITLLHAARLLVPRWPGLHWVIAGDGELRHTLLWLRDELGLQDQVHFFGHIPDTLGLIADVDVFVMSSREEGLGTSVLDAMARGIPVASTSAGGLPEMLADGAGLLVPVGTADALAKAVDRILSDPELRCRLVEGAQRAVAEFSAERMADQVRTVYRSCAPFP